MNIIIDEKLDINNEELNISKDNSVCPDCGEKYDHDLDLNPVSFSNG